MRQETWDLAHYMTGIMMYPLRQEPTTRYFRVLYNWTGISPIRGQLDLGDENNWVVCLRDLNDIGLESRNNGMLEWEN